MKISKQVSRTLWALLWVILVFAVLLVVWAAISMRNDPFYDGRFLSEWVGYLSWGSTSEKRRAAEAVRSIGTNALPFLAAELRKDDSRFERWTQDLPIIGSREPNHRRRIDALNACQELGPLARHLIPDINYVLTNANRHVYYHYLGMDKEERELAALILARFEPETTPLLVHAAQSEALGVRHAVMSGLGQLKNPDDAAKEVLKKCVADSSDSIATLHHAVLALCRIGEPDKVWLSPMTNLIHVPKGYIQTCFIEEIGECGPKARAVVPHLCELLGQANGDDSNAVFQAIQRIDPETARQLGLR